MNIRGESTAGSTYDGVLYNSQGTVLKWIPKGRTGIVEVSPKTRIIGHRAAEGSLISGIELPDSLESISSKAFNNCIHLRRIMIPDNVSDVGSYAFNNCSNLMEVSFPASCRSVKEYTFNSCGLDHIDLPEGVIEISEYAFRQNWGLVSLTIPNTLTKFSPLAMSGCENFRRIILKKDNINFYWKNGVLYSFDKKNIIFGAVGISKFDIDEAAETVKINAFKNHSTLETIDLKNVNLVEDEAFYYCKKLLSITFNDSPNSQPASPHNKIGKRAFAQCYKLKEISLPGRFKIIDEEAFANILREDYRPNSDTIKKSALRNIILPSELTTISK